LSLWLVTLQQDRPFTFLDHALKCGDSLLGISDFSQLEHFSLRPEWKQVAFGTLNLWRHIEVARDKRRALEALPSDTPAQIAAKQALHEQAETALAKLRALADGLIGLELRGLTGMAYQVERDAVGDRLMALWANGTLAQLQQLGRESLGNRRPLHWPLAFPEIMERGGFNAFVGNPPFMGGSKLETQFGADWRYYLVSYIASNITGIRGGADLCTYFLLRASSLICNGGCIGFIATNSIAQGDSRIVGLDQLIQKKMVVFRAIPDAPWPGSATVHYAALWVFHGYWNGSYFINNIRVSYISSLLTEESSTMEKP